MANRSHPVDEGLIDLSVVRRRLVAAFLEDTRLSEIEKATLEAFDAAVAPIRAYRAKERYADYWLKGGDLGSRYGTQLATDAGATIERLEVQHRRPKIVKMRRHEDGGPNRAA